MFDNPFDSFHKTVGKAKREREQLDRLLTISTPGELALVAVTAFVLLVFVAWLLFGSVTRSVTVAGVLVEPGEQLLGESPPLQAVVWLQRDLARQIEAGMPVLIEVVMTDGESQRLGGEVARVAAVPFANGSAPFEPAAPVMMHRVHIALDEGLDSVSPYGPACRIVIELGRPSPFAFFARRPS